MIWLKFHDGINDRRVMLLASQCRFFERKDGVAIEIGEDAYLIPMLTLERLAEELRGAHAGNRIILEL